MESVSEVKISGPFGQYSHGSMGAVLNTLTEVYHVPLHLAEVVQIGFADHTGTVTYQNKLVARFRWFEGINYAVMMFVAPEWRIYGQQEWVNMGGNKLKPKFKLTLNGHLSPCFEINGMMATEKLYQFLLYPMLTNYMDHPCYELSKKSGAFFQGGSDRPDGNWFMIEFSANGKGALEWLEYLNNHYVDEVDRSNL